MICPNCNHNNESGNDFCPECGTSLTSGERSQETKLVDYGNSGGFRGFATPGPPTPPARSGSKAIWVLGGIIVVLAGGIAAMMAGVFDKKDAEVFPDHLGLFIRNETRYDEVKKQDTTNALTTKDTILKDDSTTVVSSTPNLLLYADPKEINANDLKLIQLDTVKNDGTMKQLEFQVAPVDGKTDMRRLRVQQQLANGKYAFAMLDGFFDEGKHKFWPFRVTNSTKGDNNDVLKDTSAALKPKAAAPAQSQTYSGRNFNVDDFVTSTTNNLILRSLPTQNSAAMGHIRIGEMCEVIAKSTNVETFKGRTAPFVQVRKPDGTIGWAFAAFLK